jgi:hypothetical protein
MQPVAGNTSACDPNVSLMTVRACPNEPLGGDPWNFGSVQAAYNGVAAGGTVNICDGVHSVSALTISKGVTLQPIGPGMPILDGNGADFVLNRSGGNFASVFRGLKFRNAMTHLILVGNNSGTLLVENSVFEPRQQFAYNPDRLAQQRAFWSGIGVMQAVGTVTIRNNTFTGGDIGVHINTGPATGLADVTVNNNQFTGQSNSSLFTGQTNANFRLHAEGNTFDQCGRLACTEAFGQGGGRVEYVNNRLNVDASRHTHIGMNVMVTGGSLLIKGNEILGTAGSGDRAQQLGYAIDGVAIQVRGTAEVSGNKVTDAFGFVFSAGGTITGSDNVAARLGYVVSSGVAEINNVTLQRNDIIDYNQFVQNTPFASINLRCNWWGSATGPTNTGAQPATVWTPFATQPVAGKPAVVCNP